MACLCLKYVACYGIVVAIGMHHQQGDEINVLKAECLLTCHNTGILSLLSPVQVMQDSSMTHSLHCVWPSLGRSW